VSGADFAIRRLRPGFSLARDAGLDRRLVHGSYFPPAPFLILRAVRWKRRYHTWINGRNAMDASDDRRIVARNRFRWLLHPPFVSVGGSLLIAAFASDIMYSQTSLMQWANASAWLIAAGLVFALIAAIALLIDRFAVGGRRISWLDLILLAVAALLSLVNVFVHSRDAWTSVVPQGLWLSGISALLLVIEAFRGWTATVPLVREGDLA
jgi:uncharacterized membrane protein